MLKYLAIIIFIFLCSNTKAISLPASNVLNQTTAYVCDSDISDTLTCSNITNQYLVTAAKLLAAPLENPECVMNNQEVKCQNDLVKHGDLYYTIFNAKKGILLKYHIRISLTGHTNNPQNYSIENITPTPIEIAQASELYYLNERHLALVKYYSYSQVGSSFTNELGDSLPTPTNCHTAMDYVNSGEQDFSALPCDGFLNTHIDRVHPENVGDFYDKLEKWELTIGSTYGSTKLFPRRDNKLSMVLRYQDGSILVIEMTGSGKYSHIAVEVILRASRDSQGRTLETASTLLEDRATRTISRSEFISWGISKGCDKRILTIGDYRVVQATVIEKFPYGNPKRVSVKTTSQSAITENIYECG